MVRLSTPSRFNALFDITKIVQSLRSRSTQDFRIPQVSSSILYVHPCITPPDPLLGQTCIIAIQRHSLPLCCLRAVQLRVLVLCSSHGAGRQTSQSSEVVLKQRHECILLRSRLNTLRDGNAIAARGFESLMKPRLPALSKNASAVAAGRCPLRPLSPR
ncbi:uncharacterized protein LACBIDRAFT_301814 [Laccaria bicolor S238N-H82]|uniref:Predicted protein n=1 Tax=Laccaria bicolor (strain S238N-H82 / ATCC MYA-4686) TaxID=486041 RepID=B0CPD0_LACBS|nr:uncharacterized protein LACBIDRAFT_301814 [Laccaria bicolor S238N-H82]EDR15453.1 predicted protein [Laccaria bicolor S238N-H82]|eukprot:XP_001873661.1 predicted protein [Laccaria bicolor S238N-H82]